MTDRKDNVTQFDKIRVNVETRPRKPRPPKPPAPKEPCGDDPDSWPVTPLGQRGKSFYFLDAMGQLQEMKPNDFSRLGIKALFGKKNHVLELLWPRYGTPKKGELKPVINGPDYDDAASALISACSNKGVWDPFGSVRGRGSWLSDDGELILHVGDGVLIGRHVYPTDKPRARMWESPVAGGERGCAQQLLKTLQSWKWKRGELDARLMLGWIGAAMIAGAIDWRPVVWVTGGRGTGKSTLHHLLEKIFDAALVAVSDASAAGVWQKLGHATLPVTLDEVEADEDNRRGQSLIKFARQAASGGLVLRGGSDHGASEFTARSCFLFSSILVPPLQGQDLSRMAILELGELGSEPELVLDTDALRELGQKLLRRLVDGWPRWKETLGFYRAKLVSAGHSARGADVFGTLLAAGDMLLEDAVPHADCIEELLDQLDARSLAETEDDARDEDRCLQHLITQTIPLDGVGARRPIAEWIRRAAGLSPSEDEEPGGATVGTEREARNVLGRYGLKVTMIGEQREFAVASAHAELGKTFAGTQWAGRSGAIGVWTQSLRRLPGARNAGKNLWFASASAKATLIPLEHVLSDPDPEDLPRPVAGRFDFRNGGGRP